MNAKRVAVKGLVQGVGFRPFVYGLALRHGLRGWVRNTSAGVDIAVEGEPDGLQLFLAALTAQAPPLARIDSLAVQEAPADGLTAFEIRDSAEQPGAFQPIPADVALCPDCERELFDPGDRRYLYPFINCTNCGPRFTIIRCLPYDRPATTMSAFALCPDCAREYADPLNRRFHAQPVACPACGPELQFAIGNSITNNYLPITNLLATRLLLRSGAIVAVKGLGGFHLACDAANAEAVAELRRRKGRVDKPFAIMVNSPATAEELCEIDQVERGLLTGREKPILILKRRKLAWVAGETAPGVETLGVMLPYTPLHHLLLNQTDPVLAAEPAPRALVMTSGNFSEEPLAIDNDEARQRLAPLADAFLLHNRDIHQRCDDSVVRVLHAPLFLRRSRGYAPQPIELPFDAPPILAVGGELKNAFCLTRDRYAFLSQHIGDLENAETLDSFEQSLEHLSRLFHIEPAFIAHDLHPDYLSTQYAARHLSPAARIAVQHHHAHIAACLADNGVSDDEPVVGLAFDGTGYGTDGAIWGGEFLITNYNDFRRVAHLEYLPLPGGDAATRHPWRIALGYAAALDLDVSGLPFLQAVDPRAAGIVRQQVAKRLNAPLTSSMGRLFDAVAVLAGGRGEVTYEAQAAIELETAANGATDDAQEYPFDLAQVGQERIIRVRDLLQAVIDDARRGQPLAVIGHRFHRTLATIVMAVCDDLRRESGLTRAALSGGVWQNTLLLDLVIARLQTGGFTVYTHHQFPANDGGLSLGQAAVAAHRILDS